ncbi:MAG: cytochrome P450 [Chloroflexi bacterium]|nr:cytochrome P450 [Chloroflexota bacterium]MCI0578913.1 cytochrome P450 [Chloroflexota bacterium]MCI0647540.1 cytochrome P450 [Chloroflexota bacterium]MCI0730851.1 cytochrome P450 [Chloroflexota bacterium]
MAVQLPGPTGLANLTYGRLFLTRPYAAIAALYAAYGPVFVYGQGPFRYFYLIGPEANHYLLASNPGNFRWREAFEVLAPIDGETALILSDGEDHKRRRASPDEADDVMALLVATKDETGDFLSNLEVRDQVVSLIAAGFDTTSAAMGWAVYAMLKEPAIWERARAEVEQVTGRGPLAVEHLGQLPYLDWVISETLRLYSPAVIGVRKAAAAFEFGGYTIPAGSMVIYSQYITQWMDE